MLSLDYMRQTLDDHLFFLCKHRGLDLDISLVIDKDGKYPEVRDFAKTDGVTIYFSPKILKCSDNRFQALLRHELGHAILMALDREDHSEVDADLTAEVCFGDKIYYDDEDVQTLENGRYPRPSYLPK